MLAFGPGDECDPHDPKCVKEGRESGCKGGAVPGAEARFIEYRVDNPRIR